MNSYTLHVEGIGYVVPLDEYERLRDRLVDYEESHRVTVDNCGAPDEQHCSCVPSLRLEIERLRGLLRDIRADAQTAHWHEDIDAALAGEAATGHQPSDSRSCTCHPDDNPPVPCQRQYALTECRKAASLEALRELTRQSEELDLYDMPADQQT